MQNIPLFDAHCDTASKALAKSQGLRRNALHTDLTRGGAYAPYAQVFAVFADGGLPDVTGRCEAILSFLEAELAKNADIVALCGSAEEIQNAAAAKKIAALISVEGAEQLGCSTARLAEVYRRGVRIVNPCWNHNNALCGAAIVWRQDSAGAWGIGSPGGGLTAQGREFIRAAQGLGVAVDVSHMSEAAFWDACEIAQKPLLASHSNSKALCGHPRNLTDAQFCAIAEMGGAVGINLVADFLEESGAADPGAVLRHIGHFLSLSGEKTVCLGGDLDGTNQLPRGFGGVESYAALYELLLEEDYGEGLVRDIFYNNLLSYFERAL